MSETTKQREKLKHVQACLLKESQYQKSAGFDAIELTHEPAASLSLRDVSLATQFLGFDLLSPLMIAPMTGGMELGAILNQRWARAAEHFSLAFGVGSQRLALDDERVKQSFIVRSFAPTTLIFANLGAAQLVQPLGIERARQAVAMIEANALFVHLNPLQEACKEHGDGDFRGFLSALRELVMHLEKSSIPVLVREVGFGLSEKATKALLETGVSGLDCAGAGGTSWTKVEALCAQNQTFRKLGEAFGEWGIPTAEAIKNVRRVHASIPLVATGGIRSGIDAVKALALGADLVGMAQPMLVAAMKSDEELFSFIEQVLLEMRVAMFATGVRTISELKNSFSLYRQR